MVLYRFNLSVSFSGETDILNLHNEIEADDTHADINDALLDKIRQNIPDQEEVVVPEVDDTKLESNEETPAASNMPRDLNGDLLYKIRNNLLPAATQEEVKIKANENTLAPPPMSAGDKPSNRDVEDELEDKMHRIRENVAKEDAENNAVKTLTDEGNVDGKNNQEIFENKANPPSIPNIHDAIDVKKRDIQNRAAEKVLNDEQPDEPTLPANTWKRMYQTFYFSLNI